MTELEKSEAFIRGGILGDFDTTDSIEALCGQIAFSFVPFVADGRDYIANVFVNLDTKAGLINLGGFLLDLAPVAGSAADAAKAFPKLSRFIAKYADDAPKVVEAIVQAAKEFPHSDEVVAGVAKILPAGAIDDVCDSIRNGNKITKSEYEILKKIFETSGRSTDELAEIAIKNCDEIVSSIIKTSADYTKYFEKSPKGLIGVEFEKYLTDSLHGVGSFKVAGREFDGALDNVWWEAKSGEYWSILDNSKALEKFKSDMGHRLKIARDNGATYELFSNTPIPDNVKQWLTKKGIPFTEILH